MRPRILAVLLVFLALPMLPRTGFCDTSPDAQALALYHAHHYDAAIPVYQKALKLNAHDVTALIGMGNCYQAKGKPNPNVYVTPAIHRYQAALKIAPNNVDALGGLANCYQTEGDSDKEETAQLRITQILPNDPAAHAALAQDYDDNNDQDKAISERRIVVRLRPNDAAAHLALGTDLDNNENYPEAIQEYEASLRLNPHQPAVHLALGNVWNALHDEGAALAQWRAAIATGPSSDSASTARDHISDLRKAQRLYWHCAVPCLVVALASLLWLGLRAPWLYRRAAFLPDDRTEAPPFGLFNLGICLYTLYWGLSNQIWRAIWVIVPGYHLAVNVYYGFVGSRRAWAGPREQSARAFSLTHLAWAQASAWLFLVLSLLFLWLAYLLTHTYRSILGWIS